MPELNIVDRFKRLKAIQELIDQGKNEKEIGVELGLDVRSVRKNIKYIKDLELAEITSKEIGEKRSELYLELIEAADEAKQMFEDYKSKPKVARGYFISWMDTVKLRMQLYGLDNIKQDPTLIQINSMTHEPDMVDIKVGKKLADMIKKNHEQKAARL